MLEVIGAGFGRTGTHSLGLALEKLGFSPCYSVTEVAKNPGHTEIWNQAIDGEPIDWNYLFNSYRSTIEWLVSPQLNVVKMPIVERVEARQLQVCRAVWAVSNAVAEL